MNIKYLILLLLWSALASNSHAQDFRAQKQLSAYEVDGQQENWPALIFSEDSTFAYTFSHQDHILFANLYIPDSKLQNHILLTGLTLWIDSRGKKKREKGIHYPTGYKQQDILRDPMRFREVLEAVQDQKNEISERLNSMELLNFHGKDTRVWGKNMNPDAINVMVKFDDAGALVYEAAIPLRAVFSKEEDLQKALKKGFSVGWETGELGRPELRGDDAVGLSGSNPANPVRFQSEWDRSFQRELNIYRTYAVPEKIWIKRLIFD